MSKTVNKAIAANLDRLANEARAAEPASHLRLTNAERAGIAQSRDDFRNRRVLSIDEAEARTTAFLAARRAARDPT